MISDPGDGYSVISDTLTVRSAYQTEENKQKQQKQTSGPVHSYLDVLYDEWINKLKTANVSIFTFQHCINTPIDLSKCATRDLGCQSYKCKRRAWSVEIAPNAPYKERSHDFLD